MSAIPSIDSEDIALSTSSEEQYLPHPRHLGCYWCSKLGSSSKRLKRPKCKAPIASERMNKLVKVYQKWIDVHQLSLHALSGALIRSTGGVQFTLTNGRSLVVTLLPKSDAWDDGDPAKWFSIADARMCNMDENPYLDTRGKDLVNGQPQAQASAAADFIDVGTDDSAPEPPLGVLPVTYFVVNEGATFHSLHPIRAGDPTLLEYIPPRELVPWEEEFMVDAYDDLANMCIACVNMGIVFHEPKDQRKDKLPQVGSYERTGGGSWRWTRMADGWEILNVMMKLPGSGMNKAEWTADKLWLMWGSRLYY
ncbi:hypothetical protein GSI_03856 [Ganoderma sinense ZZ0214-1]|uniref:Uncharacterized protein n=1 Tax=Ganoderma sinense ZZ0214-1 TaxID=1077348 RepID=A0A2G8SK51_9APHY|nr:hypothetical protein GSI_03856 [Ganoderma sinense ZZ0214-1]